MRWRNEGRQVEGAGEGVVAWWGKAECGAGVLPLEAQAVVGMRAELQPCKVEREEGRVINIG